MDVDGSREPAAPRGPGRGLFAAPAFGWLLPLVALLGVLVTVFLVYRTGLAIFLFFPVFILVIPYFGSLLLSNPVPIISAFLLVVVNLDFFKIGETRLTLDILLSAVLLYGLVVRLTLEGKRIFTTTVERVFLIYLAVTLLSVVLSVKPATSLKNWGREIEYLILFAFLYGYNLTFNQKRHIVAAAVFSSVIPCVVGIVGLILGIPSLLGVETPVGGGAEVVRITSTLSHPVVFSHHLSIVTTVAIALFLDGRWIRRRYLAMVIGLQLVTLYLTYARTGWGEFAAGIATLFWMLGYRKVVLLVIPLVVIGLLKVIPNFAGRLENAVQADDNSLLWRVGLWLYAISLFPRRPFFGSGQGTFAEYVSYQEGFAAHQSWLNLLIETGLVGLLAYFALSVAIWKALARKRRDPRFARDPLVVGVFAGWVGLLVGSLAGDPFNIPAASLYLWTFLALALRHDPPPFPPRTLSRPVGSV